MYKKINRNNTIFQDNEFKKDKYKYYIALKIINNENSIIYSNEKDYVIMQMSKEMPIWIWTKDSISTNLVLEIKEIIDLYYNKNTKITCKEEFFDLLIKCDINVDKNKIFKMGCLHCENTILPKTIKGKMEIADLSNLNVLSKYWYDDYLEMEDDNYSIEQSILDMKAMIEEGNFYILKNHNNKIVSMARYTKIENIASINKVYTPIEERQKGYCENLIYALSNKLLNSGIVPMLYTDYDYIPSNKAYMNVGYIIDGTLISFYF